MITVAYQGWTGVSNGELISAAEQAGFDVIVTADQGVRYQQNLSRRQLALVVLSTNRRSLVLEHAAKVDLAISEVQPCGFIFLDIGF